MFDDVELAPDSKIVYISPAEKNNKDLEVFEVYRISRQFETQINPVAIFNEAGNFIVTSKPVYKQRGNLNGLLLKTGSAKVRRKNGSFHWV